MAKGNLSVGSGTRVGSFNIPLSITEAVSAVSNANLNAVAVDGNGITGVSFVISGSGASYNIAVILPNGVTGRFRLSLQGTVTPVGSGVAEAVTSNTVTIAYDTASVVIANWGTIEYRDGGEIVLPVVFGEDITYLHKTDFTLERVAGDEVWEVIDDYWLVQRADSQGNVDARTFYLHFLMVPDKQGRFRVSLTGYVFKTATTIRDDVRIDPIEVPYNTSVPEVSDRRVVRTGERIDLILLYDAPCTVNDPTVEFGSDMAMFSDFLDYDGPNLSTDPSTTEPLPNFYRKVSNDYPTLPLPEELPEADWATEDLTTENATIYLLRWTGIEESADFGVTVKPGFVRGPVR